MEQNGSDLRAQFPELQRPEETVQRLSDAFVAPEYARTGIALIRRLVNETAEDAHLGRGIVVTAPSDYANIVVTVGKWWLLNFHIAEAEALEEGDAVEEIDPDDYEEVLEGEQERTDTEELESIDVEDDEDDEEADADGEEEFYEATFYQVGTFLLDNTVIPYDTVFEREDFEFYAYDFPEDRISAERFYYARMVWEPADLESPEIYESLKSAINYILTHHGEELPFGEYHDEDFAAIVMDADLCDRLIAAGDFGDVVVINGEEE